MSLLKIKFCLMGWLDNLKKGYAETSQLIMQFNLIIFFFFFNFWSVGLTRLKVCLPPAEPSLISPFFIAWECAWSKINE